MERLVGLGVFVPVKVTIHDTEIVGVGGANICPLTITATHIHEFLLCGYLYGVGSLILTDVRDELVVIVVFHGAVGGLAVTAV